MELQCLLWLLCYPNYRAPATAAPPHAHLSNARRDRLWHQLQKRGLVDFEMLVTRFGLSAKGRVVLQLDTSVLPITPDERYVLLSCRDRSIHPDQISRKVPCNLRQSLIVGLSQQNLIRITQQRLGEIWLTSAGEAFLQQAGALPGDVSAVS